MQIVKRILVKKRLLDKSSFELKFIASRMLKDFILVSVSCSSRILDLTCSFIPG